MLLWFQTGTGPFSIRHSSPFQAPGSGISVWRSHLHYGIQGLWSRICCIHLGTRREWSPHCVIWLPIDRLHFKAISWFLLAGNVSHSSSGKQLTLNSRQGAKTRRPLGFSTYFWPVIHYHFWEPGVIGWNFFPSMFGHIFTSLNSITWHHKAGREKPLRKSPCFCTQMEIWHH